MCVIFVADTSRPTEEMIHAAWRQNDAGAGIAWREPAEDGDGMEVVWKKGLSSAAEVFALSAQLPLPQILHFRIPSCGGRLKSLTHPHPISEKVETYLEGRTKGEVLFHNGHWGSWKTYALELCRTKGVALPEGPLSDTRIMAWCAHYYGKNIVELIDEKGVSFSPYGEPYMFMGSGWHVENDVWCSNLAWKYGSRTGDVTGAYSSYNGGANRHRVCLFGSCRNSNVDASGYCPEHTKVKTGTSTGTGAASQNPTQTPVTSTPGASGIEIAKNDANKSATSVPGGAHTPTFFRQAWESAERLNKAGRLSKKKVKKARNAYYQSLREAQQQKEALPKVQPGLMPSEPPIVWKRTT